MTSTDSDTLQLGSIAAPSVADSLRVCLITLGEQWFGIELGHVGEVFKVERVTTVPAMPPAVVGVTNLRGTIVPLVDLRRLLGLAAPGPLPYAVVLRHAENQVGVLVDRVPEIRTVPRADLRPPGSSGTGQKRFVSAVLRLEERMGGMVEVPTLLASVETS